MLKHNANVRDCFSGQSRVRGDGGRGLDQGRDGTAEFAVVEGLKERAGDVGPVADFPARLETRLGTDDPIDAPQQPSTLQEDVDPLGSHRPGRIGAQHQENCLLCHLLGLWSSTGRQSLVLVLVEGDQDFAGASLSGNIVVGRTVRNTRGLAGLVPVRLVPVGCVDSHPNVDPRVVGIRRVGVELGVNPDVDDAGAISRPRRGLCIASWDETQDCLVWRFHGLPKAGPKN